jgi:hypothetical protein
MTKEELTKLRNYFSKKSPLTQKEVALRRILNQDDNLYRIDTTLSDMPDLRSLTWDILEVL